jgi:hypothetical protein
MERNSLRMCGLDSCVSRHHSMGRILYTRQWTVGFRNRLPTSSPAERLSDSQKQLCSTELVNVIIQNRWVCRTNCCAPCINTYLFHLFLYMFTFPFLLFLLRSTDRTDMSQITICEIVYHVAVVSRAAKWNYVRMIMHSPTWATYGCLSRFITGYYATLKN